MPVEIFVDELEFYDLGVDVVDKFRTDEGLSTDDCSAEFGEGQLPALPRGQFRRAVWLLFEYPESSSAARAVAVLSVSVILLSIATFCLETLPQFKQYSIVHGPPAATATAAHGPNKHSCVCKNLSIRSFVLYVYFYSGIFLLFFSQHL